MLEPEIIILVAKNILAVMVVWCVWMFPAYLARQNGIDELDMARVRIASWLFGWTVLGWFAALWWAMKK
ncbi:MAG: hypothetical protein FWE64_01820 [Alphaproteobacteria bacterium]|nr:hypothetical protein [Alphaproteobacteria bacterium]